MNNHLPKLKPEEKELFEYVRKYNIGITISENEFIPTLSIVLKGTIFELKYEGHTLFIINEYYTVEKSDDNIKIIDTDNYLPFIKLLKEYKNDRELKIVYLNEKKTEELKKYLQILNK